MGRLDNKIALVTGGNSGIGLAIARKFTQEGAKVIITARRKTELEQALLSIGGKTIAIPADLTSAKDRTRIIEEINARYGRLDIFIANAGRSEIQVMTEVTELNYDALFNLNAKAAFFSLQDALPLMGNGGSIVLVASIAHFKGTPNLSIYSASKAALRSFARTLTSELAERGIRVNVRVLGSRFA